MFNLILTGTAAAESNGVLDILLYALIAIFVIVGFILAFASGRLSIKKIIKNPKILVDEYHRIMETIDKKIQKAEKKEAKALKKDDAEKADKYHEQRSALIEARERMLEATEENQEPKLDNKE